MDARYRVVLTGDLIEGYEKSQAVDALSAMLRQPPDKVQLVFGRRATPLNRVLDYRGARDIQQRLQAIGVGCKVEVVENRAPAAFAAHDLATKPLAEAKKQITCHYCGKTQDYSPACSGCGAYLLPDRSPSISGPGSFGSPVAPGQRNARERMMLFIGPRAERYLEKFERFKEGKYALGWNWAAFLGGVIWTAYRKLWLWTGFLLVLTAMPYVMPVFGLASLVLYLVFVASADYLYFRHVQKRLARLDSQTEDAIESAGGGSVLAGIAVMFVASGLVMWLGIVQAPFSFAHIEKASGLVLKDPQIRGIADTPQGQATILAFTATAAAVYAWQARGGDLGKVSAAQLMNGGLDEEVLTDGWGTPMMVVPDPDGFIILSPGPDGSFDSDDDIPIPFPAN